MFCKVCGKYNDDGVTRCENCGTVFTVVQPKAQESQVNRSSEPRTAPSQESQATRGESKTVVGVLMCLFLGIIGLIIGLLLYPAGTVERSTFLSGWVKCLVVSIILYVVFIVFVTCAVGCNL